MQGTVLGIAVDLSALPYLLRLILGSLPRGCPFSVIPSRLRLRRLEKELYVEVWCTFGQRNESESEVSVVPSLVGLPVGEVGRSRKQASSPPWPGLPVGKVDQSRRPSGRRLDHSSGLYLGT